MYQKIELWGLGRRHCILIVLLGVDALASAQMYPTGAGAGTSALKPIGGKVEEATSNTIRIAVEGAVMPKPGEPVRVFFRIPGAMDEVEVGRGNVTKAESGIATAQITEVHGAVERGHLVTMGAKAAGLKTIPGARTVPAGTPLPAPPPASARTAIPEPAPTPVITPVPTSALPPAPPLGPNR